MEYSFLRFKKKINSLKSIQMETTGYGYGIWLRIHTFPRKLQHIPHVTLVCNIPTQEEATQIWKELKSHFQLQQPLHIRVLPKAQIFEGTYSEKDPYTKCWGYHCELIDISQTTIQQWINTIMQQNHIPGSTSEQPHITIDYETTESLEDLPSTMELDADLVVADILGSYEKWHILK